MTEQRRACLILWADDQGHEPQPVYFGTDEWKASLDWARFFGIDPMRVPSEAVIVVDTQRFTISYPQTRLDESGRLVVDGLDVVTDATVIQLEGPPLPIGHPAIPRTGRTP